MTWILNMTANVGWIGGPQEMKSYPARQAASIPRKQGPLGNKLVNKTENPCSTRLAVGICGYS